MMEKAEGELLKKHKRIYHLEKEAQRLQRKLDSLCSANEVWIGPQSLFHDIKVTNLLEGRKQENGQ